VTIGIAIAAVVAVLGVVAITAANGTLARFSDDESGGTSTTAAATVVLGGHGTPIPLAFTGLGSGTSATRTLTLSVVYQGSVPATIQFQLPSGATATNCVRSGTTYADPGGFYRTLTITLGSQAPVPYCSLLDGVARTLVTTVQPGTTTAVPITVTAGGVLSLIGRNEAAPIAVRAVGGFTDVVTGTIQITASGLFTPAPAPLPAAATTPSAAARSAPAATAATPPQDCVDAGLGPFAETVQLTAARPRFVAAEDRPGAPGPFLVVGTGADDTITGSPAGDCVVAGAGADVVDGAGGGDVLLGDDGADRIDGGPGDDVLRGAAGADRLTGGAGADLIDGGPDGAVCDIGPEDKPASSCGSPAVEAPATTAVAPTVPAPVVGPTTTPGPASAAPVAPTTTPPTPTPPTTPPPTTTTPTTTPAPTPAPAPAPDQTTIGVSPTGAAPTGP
jgi:Ca2+-binding RTX toxin-like protein